MPDDHGQDGRDPAVPDPDPHEPGPVPAQSLHRDAQLAAYLAGQCPTGDAWITVEAMMADYAYGVLLSWFTNRTIEKRAQRLRPTTRLSGPEWDCLGREPAERVALVSALATEGLLLFRRAILDGRWDPRRNTSLQTYYINACLLSFGNVVRRWRREQTPIGTYSLDDPAVALDPRIGQEDDGFTRVTDGAELAYYLDRMPPELARAVRLKQAEPGLNWSEVARRLGLGRTLDTQLRDFRRRNHRNDKEGG